MTYDPILHKLRGHHIYRRLNQEIQDFFVRNKLKVVSFVTEFADGSFGCVFSMGSTLTSGATMRLQLWGRKFSTNNGILGGLPETIYFWRRQKCVPPAEKYASPKRLSLSFVRLSFLRLLSPVLLI